MSKIWGYILEAPGRPKKAAQIEALTALGADPTEFGTIWHDKVAKGSTRPRGQLEDREALLNAVMSGDTVVFAAVLCIGVGVKDVEWFLGELAQRGVSVIVNGDLTRIGPGGDTAALQKRFASAQNVNNKTRSIRGETKSK
jgi:hypothetical protein